ncbi:MAG: hypothetical protein A7316_08550 [Candidatus Altiarchaeales archaeon WOR_SM1_86-2]|nr:MAG: hypothetical protein A7316_08550 [Candidatus Altiarchaeales archaeon WOR_SM1_86-2]
MKQFDKKMDFEWADQVEKYKSVSPKYEEYAKILEKVLKKASGKYAPLAIVQTRPKAIASFAEKILRKSYLYTDPINELTDLCGARVITHTRDEVRAMCRFIEEHFEIDWVNSVDISQRLKPTEFGYRSVHYIVQFKRGVFPNDEVDIKIPDDVFPEKECPMKAEIQVRTILEHSWADFAHERSYKSAFKIPAKWERELAGLAAMLEESDNAFSRINSGLQEYASGYGAYTTEEKTRDEIRMLEFVLNYDPENAELAHRIGKLAITIGDWQKAIEVLSKYINSGYQQVLRDLGIAICNQYKANPDSPDYKKGQEYIENAVALDNKDAESLASLAGTWKGIDNKKAKEYYHKAFELDPSNSYSLGNYLECEIIDEKDISSVSLMAPLINDAIKRCKNQAEVGMNIPWAFYDMGKFYLLLGKPYASIDAYAKAIQLSTEDWMIETSFRSIDNLAAVRDKLLGYEWILRLLMVGRAVRFGKPDAMEKLKEMASTGQDPILSPVVIVAGGCSQSVEQKITDYEGTLIEAFKGFKGTIISGGTTSGVGGLVGSVQEKYPNSIRTMGYLPKQLPEGVRSDSRYSEIRYTEGNDFSVLEPLQNWIDLIASGIMPDQVKLLGINGGKITGAEYSIALALGASVAVVGESGRETGKLLRDHKWGASNMLIPLPSDAVVIKAFIGAANPELSSDIRETIARAIHEDYRRVKTTSGLCDDPSMADWDKLRDNLKESNLQQADHIFEKLHQIGCSVHEVRDRPIALMTFNKGEIETMAKMEHARWVVERLMDGWKLGEKKDITKKISPYLVPWSKLPENIKEWDRDPVRKIPEFLANVGLEVHRKE